MPYYVEKAKPGVSYSTQFGGAANDPAVFGQSAATLVVAYVAWQAVGPVSGTYNEDIIMAELTRMASQIKANVNGRRTWSTSELLQALQAGEVAMLAQKWLVSELGYLRAVKRPGNNLNNIDDLINEVESKVRVLKPYTDVLPVCPNVQKVINLFGKTEHERLGVTTLILPDLVVIRNGTTVTILDLPNVNTPVASLRSTFNAITAYLSELSTQVFQAAADIISVVEGARVKAVTEECGDYEVAKLMLRNAPHGLRGTPNVGGWTYTGINGKYAPVVQVDVSGGMSSGRIVIDMESYEDNSIPFEALVGVPWAVGETTHAAVSAYGCVMPSIISVSNYTMYAVGDVDDNYYGGWFNLAGSGDDWENTSVLYGILIGLGLISSVALSHGSSTPEASEAEGTIAIYSRETAHHPITFETLTTDTCVDVLAYLYFTNKVHMKSNTKIKDGKRGKPTDNKE